MDKLAATLNPGGTNAKSPAADKSLQPVGVAGVKFSYATGARPLDGYTIKRGVGVGGFGEVYYAVSDGGKEVAIKRIQRNLDVEIRGVSHCLNLKHSNLLGLFDIRYDDQGQAWVIMEYVAGESLKDVIDRNPHGLPVEEVRRWFAGMARGVEYLHDHGIVHRDLKPGNIFLDQDIVKIGDYGLAKFISCSRRSGHTESVGTFHYMAPEIGRGVYGKEIDIYALGIILFEMLTGNVPFEGESSQEIIMKHLTADPDLSRLPRPYRQVIQRTLYKDPAKRYASVADMVRDLELSSEPGAPKRVPPIATESAFAQSPAAEVVAGSGPDIVFGPVKVQESALGGASATDEMRFFATQPTATPRPPLDEPIARAAAHGWNRTLSWWKASSMTPAVRVAVILLLILTLIFNSQWLLPLCVILSAAYLIYFGVRSLIGALHVPATQEAPASREHRRMPPAANRGAAGESPFRPIAGAGESNAIRGGRRSKPRMHWRAFVRESLAKKSLSEHCTELSGSMLLSAVVAIVLSMIALAIGGKPLNASVDVLSHFAFLAITTTASAWLVLAVSKVWEGSDGDEVRRRFVMLVTGLVIGAIGFIVVEFLNVQLANSGRIGHTLDNLYLADGSPRLGAFLLYFGGIFLAVRWWKQTDPLRESRFSFFATLVCVALARVLDQFTPVSATWGMMIVGIIAIAVQLAAPWLSDSERERIKRELHEA